jgi:hypothetical protein
MDHSKPYSILESSILSKPRMMGTPAEEQTTQFLLDYLGEAGLSPYTEKIHWSRAFVIARKVMALLLIPWLVGFNLSLDAASIRGGILSIVLPILSIFFIGLVGKTIRDDKFSYLGNLHSAKNVICDIDPPASDDAQNRIYLTAHTDSVGSSMPKLNLPLTIGGFLFFLLSLLTTIIGGILVTAGSGGNALAILQLVLLVISSISSLMIMIGLFAKRVNTSPGAIDNGSGSAILLSLAEHYQVSPLQNTSLRLIFCTAEEWGLYGSKGYVRTHQEELAERADQDLLINVDMVGSELSYVKKAGLVIKKPLNKDLNKLIDEVANNLNIEVRGFNTPLGNNSDHAPFRKQKMETAFFLSKKDTKKIHKPLDTIENVDPQKLEDAVKLITAVVNELDQ